MITDITVKNFRCYQGLHIRDTGRVNVVVGENGSGKTSLLEAIFLALGRTTELAARYRTHRGFDPSLGGQINRIEEAIWKNLFYKKDWSRPIEVRLRATSEAARSVVVSKSTSQMTFGLPAFGDLDESTTIPLSFKWTNAQGREFLVVPRVSGGRLEFPETGEDGFDFYYFASNMSGGSSSAAERFSHLSQSGKSKGFVKAFKSVFPNIDDVSLEVEAGFPVIYASVKYSKERFALPLMSGAMNRVFTLMVTIASSPDSVILIDEIENGIYFERMPEIARAIFRLASVNGVQIICTTHSYEWLKAVAISAEDSLADLRLWRTTELRGHHAVEVFAGDDLKNAIEYGAELR